MMALLERWVFWLGPVGRQEVFVLRAGAHQVKLLRVDK